jgi:3',5'-cyclic-AMP phosphodiesterase
LPTFDAVADWWGIPGRYYTFDQGPIRGVVLDANEPGGGGQGYAAYIGPEQRAWLTERLSASDRPVILFVHQPLEIIRNSAEVMAILEQAEQERPGIVLAVFSGHLHQDYVETRHGIPFIQINSASYVWFGSPGPVRFAQPLWARVVVDFEAGELRLHGRRTTWLTEDVWERGGTEAAYPRDRVRPAISDRRLLLRPETITLARRTLTGAR